MQRDNTATQVYDNRLEQRKNALIHAFVSDRSDISNLKCVIRDISKSGCKIASSYIDELPRIIEIMPEGFDKPLTGKIVWRNSKIAGVEFLSAAELAAFERETPQPLHKAEPPGFLSRLQSIASLRRRAGHVTRDDARGAAEPRDYGTSVLHALRNPLTALKGMLSLLMGGSIRPIPKRARTLIRTAHKNAEKAENLVEEGLRAKNIESGRLPCHPEPLDIAELAGDVLLTNTGHAAKHDVRFALSNDVGRAMVRADTARIEDVLSSLLAQAAKSSPAGETVTLGLTRNDRAIRISVSDQGIGSGSVQMADDASDGLDICRAILGRHDADLHVGSRPGVGNTVWFELAELD